MRKFVSLLLAIVLLLSVSVVRAEEKEDIVVTVGKEFNPASCPLPAGQTHENNYMLDYIYETTGVRVEYEWVEVDDQQKISAAIATATLPDIMTVDQGQFAELCKNDMIAPIGEEFEEYANDYLKTARELYPEAFDAATYKGQLMGIPNTNVKKEHNLIWVRKDWCEKLGIEIEWGDVLTLDEMIDIATRFRDEDPDGNGENDTIALPLSKNWLFSGYRGDYAFQPVSNYFGSYADMWYLDDDGNLTYGSITDATRETLVYMAQLYQDGIIDPQFATCDELDMVVSGKCGMFFSSWSAVPIANSYLYDGADWIPVVGPVDENGVLHTRYNIPSDRYAVVSKNCEHPEALIKILSASYYILRYNTGDARYDSWRAEMAAAGISWTIMPATVSIEATDIIGSRGKDVLQFIQTGSTAGIAQENLIYCQVYQQWQKDNTYAYGIRVWKGMGYGCNVAGYEKTEYKTPIFWGVTPTMSECWSALKDAENETFMKIIMGEVGIEAFDEFVAKWHAEGGDVIMAEIEDTLGL